VITSERPIVIQELERFHKGIIGVPVLLESLWIGLLGLVISWFLHSFGDRSDFPSTFGKEKNIICSPVNFLFFF
jgi:hypothetical protein